MILSSVIRGVPIYSTVVEKGFRTPLKKIYSVTIVVFQYLAGDFVCILKGLAASDAHKQVEIIVLFIIETKCEKYILAVLVLCSVQL